MEKMMVVVFAFAFAVVAMAHEQADPAGLTPEETKKSWEDFKEAAGPDFIAALDGINVEDINQAASSVNAGGSASASVTGTASSSWNDLSSAFLTRIGFGAELNDGPSAAPGEAPSSATDGGAAGN